MTEIKRKRSTHEIKKICKIVDEITVYLAHNNNTNVEISIDFGPTKTIIFKFDHLEDHVKQAIEDGFSTEREIEFEEYGWEILGENDSTFEAKLIGRLIDDYKITKKDGKYVLKITRK